MNVSYFYNPERVVSRRTAMCPHCKQQSKQALVHMAFTHLRFFLEWVCIPCSRKNGPVPVVEYLRAQSMPGHDTWQAAARYRDDHGVGLIRISASRARELGKAPGKQAQHMSKEPTDKVYEATLEGYKAVQNEKP